MILKYSSGECVVAPVIDEHIVSAVTACWFYQYRFDLIAGRLQGARDTSHIGPRAGAGYERQAYHIWPCGAYLGCNLGACFQFMCFQTSQIVELIGIEILLIEFCLIREVPFHDFTRRRSGAQLMDTNERRSELLQTAPFFLTE